MSARRAADLRDRIELAEIQPGIARDLAAAYQAAPTASTTSPRPPIASARSPICASSWPLCWKGGRHERVAPQANATSRGARPRPRDRGQRPPAGDDRRAAEAAAAGGSARRRSARPGALEATAPALLAATPRGLLAGLFSETTPGCFTVVVATADDCLTFTPALRAIPAAIADMAAFMDDTSRKPEAVSGAIPLLLAAALEQRTLSSVWLGGLLWQPEHREQVEMLAAHGVTPAVVCLLTTDTRAAMRLVLPHGRTWPVLDLEPQAGSA